MGPSRVLHLMNPLRHEFIASCLDEGLPVRGYGGGKEESSSERERGLRYLDVGCGGGIFAESLARTIRGFDTNSTAASDANATGATDATSTSTSTRTRAGSITAIDPSSTLIQIARNHARTDPTIVSHLRTGRFQYRNTTLESLVAEQQQKEQEQEQPEKLFDVVTLFEVLEHIDPSTSSPQAFLSNCLRLLRPGGWLVGSTIARSLPSFIVNRVIAEAPWPIGVVPRGTHEWGKFVNPGEVRGWVERGVVDAGGGSSEGMKWRCSGTVYFPGLGWRMIGGAEDWGNYFWGVRKGVSVE